jgi:hypothetical protein
VVDELEKELAKEFSKDGLGGQGLGLAARQQALKAVPPSMPNVAADPQRTTKQMTDQFTKIKEGFQADLQKAEDEREQLDLRIHDLNLAIRVISTSLSMLEVGD